LVKAKCRPRQEFVIIGWTNSGTGGVFGALLLGYYDDAGKLTYAGRCGSGFTDKLAVDILRKLRPLETPKMPVQPFRRKAVDGAGSCGRAIPIGKAQMGRRDQIRDAWFNAAASILAAT
jgi:ATP-dependent DNA ligase